MFIMSRNNNYNMSVLWPNKIFITVIKITRKMAKGNATLADLCINLTRGNSREKEWVNDNRENGLNNDVNNGREENDQQSWQQRTVSDSSESLIERRCIKVAGQRQSRFLLEQPTRDSESILMQHGPVSEHFIAHRVFLVHHTHMHT